MKIKIKSTMKIPVGLITLMLYKLLVIIWLITYFIFLLTVVSIGGSVFGISNPMVLKVTLLMASAANIIALVGIYKRFNWGYWITIIYSLIVISIKIFQFITATYKDSFTHFMIYYLNTGDIFLISVNFITICYLVKNKKVRRFFHMH